MINVDHFLKMGDSHEICEDYIISGEGTFPWVILADGCSSSNFVDVGARILCHIARQHIRGFLPHYNWEGFIPQNYHIMGLRIINKANFIRDQLSLPFSSLDATLIVSYVTKNCICTYIYGDGYILIEDVDGNFSRYEIEYTPNAPQYLSYVVDHKRELEYKSKNVRKALKVIGNDLVQKDGINLLTDTFFFCFPRENIKSFLIASDGIGSFSNITVDQIQEEFSRFKKSKAKIKFVKRRVGNAIRKLEKN